MNASQLLEVATKSSSIEIRRPNGRPHYLPHEEGKCPHLPSHPLETDVRFLDLLNVFLALHFQELLSG
jgi:hypothetical protein